MIYIVFCNGHVLKYFTFSGEVRACSFFSNERFTHFGRFKVHNYGFIAMIAVIAHWSVEHC